MEASACRGLSGFSGIDEDVVALDVTVGHVRRVHRAQTASHVAKDLRVVRDESRRALDECFLASCTRNTAQSFVRIEERSELKQRSDLCTVSI